MSSWTIPLGVHQDLHGAPKRLKAPFSGNLGSAKSTRLESGTLRILLHWARRLGRGPLGHETSMYDQATLSISQAGQASSCLVHIARIGPSAFLTPPPPPYTRAQDGGEARLIGPRPGGRIPPIQSKNASSPHVRAGESPLSTYPARDLVLNNLAEFSATDQARDDQAAVCIPASPRALPTCSPAGARHTTCCSNGVCLSFPPSLALQVCVGRRPGRPAFLTILPSRDGAGREADTVAAVRSTRHMLSVAPRPHPSTRWAATGFVSPPCLEMIPCLLEARLE